MIPDHIMIGDSSSHLNRYLSENNYSKICILVDENTHSNCLKKIEGDINFDYDIFKIDSGEEEKNLATCSKLWNFLTENLYDRKSLIINLALLIFLKVSCLKSVLFKRGFILLKSKNSVESNTFSIANFFSVKNSKSISVLNELNGIEVL